MSATINIKQEQLIHTGEFEKPLLNLWGDGRKILEGLYDSFHPFGVNLADITIEGVAPADQVVTINIANQALHRFKYDRIESTFANFSTEYFLKHIPAIMRASVDWVRVASPRTRFKSHSFVDTSHSEIVGGVTADLLAQMVAKIPDSGGTVSGVGAIFQWKVPSRNWATHLLLEPSRLIPGGLFMNFSLLVLTDIVDFSELASSGRKYLAGVLELTGPISEKQNNSRFRPRSHNQV